jgi:hypothetical protein
LNVRNGVEEGREEGEMVDEGRVDKEEEEKDAVESVVHH